MNASLGFGRMDAVMADHVASLRFRFGRTVLVGVCGPQGSGKSSTAARLVRSVQGLGLKAVARSLDDFYLTRSRRHDLAGKVHPLLATRGVPGTHDLGLLHSTFDRLSKASNAELVALPTFDKALDDRVPEADWPSFEGRPDAIILEGWCVGARPQPAEALLSPVNALEELEDPDASWRNYVNGELAGPYADLFGQLDYRYLLSAPSFEAVFAWRSEQEAKLVRPSDGSRPPMSEPELRRFIAHYERLTRWIIEDEPADLIVDIGDDRVPVRWRRKSDPGRSLNRPL